MTRSAVICACIIWASAAHAMEPLPETMPHGKVDRRDGVHAKEVLWWTTPEHHFVGVTMPPEPRLEWKWPSKIPIDVLFDKDGKPYRAK